METTLVSRGLGALTAVAAVIAGTMALGAPPAAAATVNVPYLCTTTAFGTSYDWGIDTYSVTMTAPGAVNPGEPVPVTYGFDKIPLGLPFPLTNATVQAQATILAQTPDGSVTSSSTAVSVSTVTLGSVAPYATPSITADPVSVSSTGYPTGGRIEFRPGVFRLTVTSSDQFPASGAYVECVPQGTSPYAARTTVVGPPLANPSDRCVAQVGNVTGPPGCDTQQLVRLDVTAGRLTQRAYATGANPSATTIALGTVQSPFSSTAIPGDLNSITVTDNRGGTFGWSLTAQLSDFTGIGGNTIDNSLLSIDPDCSAATPANAYDYAAPGQTVVFGFDPGQVAPGVTGGISQSFGGAVQLCTKSTTDNPTTGSTGGIYSVRAPVSLNLPAFQAADAYVALMTVTLI